MVDIHLLSHMQKHFYICIFSNSHWPLQFLPRYTVPVFIIYLYLWCHTFSYPTSFSFTHRHLCSVYLQYRATITQYYAIYFWIYAINPKHSVVLQHQMADLCPLSISWSPVLSAFNSQSLFINVCSY